MFRVQPGSNFTSTTTYSAKPRLLELVSYMRLTMERLRFRVKVNTSIDAMTDIPILFDS